MQPSQQDDGHIPPQIHHIGQDTPKRKRMLLVVGILLLVVALAGLAAWFLLGTSNQQVSQTTECSPRNTPTCGPDGKPIGGTGTQVKQLDSVAVSKVTLSGAAPQGLDIDPTTGYAYIANNGTIISGCAGDTTKTTQNGGTPAPVLAGASTMSVIDPATSLELKRVNTQSAPIWPLVDTKRGVVYVAGSGDGKVGIHAISSAERTHEISVGGRPHAFGLYGSMLIVSNTHDTTQTYMTSINADTRKIITHHKTPEFPHGIAYDAKKNVFYMVGVKTGQVAVIDATSGEVKETFNGASTNGNSNMLAFSEKTRKLFISDTQPQSSVTVVNVDSRQVEGTIRFTQTSAPAWGMQVDETTGLLYVALPNADAVGIADVDSLDPLGLVKVDTCPYAVRLDTKRGIAVTANQVHATASVFKLSEVTQALGR